MDSLVFGKLKSLSHGKEEDFLREFLFQLTIAARAVAVEPGTECIDRLDGLKQINEIEHRVLGRLRAWGRGENGSSIEAFWGEISVLVKSNRLLPGWVGRALHDALAPYSG